MYNVSMKNYGSSLPTSPRVEDNEKNENELNGREEENISRVEAAKRRYEEMETVLLASFLVGGDTDTRYDRGYTSDGECLGGNRLSLCRKLSAYYTGDADDSSDGMDAGDENNARHFNYVLSLARDELQSNLLKGVISPSSERKFLEKMPDPVSVYGLEEVTNRLRVNLNRSEAEIIALALYNDDRLMEDIYDGLSSEEVKRLLDRYPMPMDFEQVSNYYLATRCHDNRSRTFCCQIMNDFKYKIYGERQEYWGILQDLRKKAEDTKEGTELGEAIRRNEEFAYRHRFEILANTHDGSAKESENASSEQEQKVEQEPFPGLFSTAQISKSQVLHSDISPERLREKGEIADESCEDSLLCDPEQRMFGVFDGVGGAVDGRLASQTAADFLREYVRSKDYEEFLHEQRYHKEESLGAILAKLLDKASDKVRMKVSGGYTTASLAIVDRDTKNGWFMSYAQVGDSRIYVVDKKGEVVFKTDDEGYENILTNALGAPNKRCVQYGNEWLEPGDRVVICSDGITGDFEPDIMSDETIGRIISQAPSTDEAAIQTLLAATKPDDRTILVVATVP